MSDLTEAYLKRKETAVLKDFDTAFAGYQRLVTQVNSIRTWTVTIMTASLALALTRNATQPSAVVGTAVLALFSFLVLELRERSSMSFNKNEVIMLELVFMERNVEKYNQLIADYEFRDLRLGRISRRQKIKHLGLSARNWTVIIWYGFWLSALLLALKLAVL